MNAALMPLDALAALAPVRTAPVTVVCHQGRAWVAWPGERPDVAACVLAAPGAAAYERRGGHWHRAGASLPDFAVPPPGEARPLDRVLLPAPLEPVPPPDVASFAPVPVRLERGGGPRPATALLTEAAAVACWAETATTRALAAAAGAACGPRVLLVGAVPALPGERLWGDDLLVPVGWRPEPDWPAEAVRSALGVRDGEVLVLTAAGAEAVPRDALRPLTRAGVRLAVRPG